MQIAGTKLCLDDTIDITYFRISLLTTTTGSKEVNGNNMP